ncbi:hypothetical protein ACP8HI_26765 [Paenibacillus sp. FA6]|uniref:hypothetical protein n=1 Tax=Paenibacillus sp. FA6 TaxID=3413029 RepID=UPI003F655E99
MLKVMMLMLGLGLVSPFSSSPMDLNITNTSTPVTIHKVFLKVFTENIQLQPLPRSDEFETVNDISLQDHIKDVIHKKGEPLQINEIPFLGCTDYEYEDEIIGICDDWVSYVHVDFSIGSFRVNGHDITMSRKKITEALGVPQFIAEDGEVYIRGDQAIKVFNDPLTGAIQSIDFFDETST